MFAYINGTLESATPQEAILDANGIGYLLYISIATFEKLPNPGAKVKLYTSLVVREDAQKLFGFLTLSEKNFFETLCDISGIGPRLAIAILGHMTIDDLFVAVSHHDAKSIAKIPGIGKKMAERLILELQGKFESTQSALPSPQAELRGPIADAVSALMNLGYSAVEAQKAVSAAAAKGEPPPLPELISLALKVRKG